MAQIQLVDVTPDGMPFKMMRIFKGLEIIPARARGGADQEMSRGFIIAATIGDAPTRYTGRTLRWDPFPAWDATFESVEQAVTLAGFVFSEWKSRKKSRTDEKPIQLVRTEIPVCVGLDPPQNASRLQVPMSLDETHKIRAIQRACQQAGTLMPGQDRPVVSLNDTFRYVLSLISLPEKSADSSAVG